MTPRRGTNGFTIVELLIVIVVIAILASVTVTAFSGVRERAVNVAVTSDARKLKGLLEQYIIYNGYDGLSAVLSSGTWYCFGENYVDLDPGAGTSCYEYSASYGYSPSSTLDNAMRSIGGYSVSSASVVRGTGTSWTESTSAPEIRRSNGILNGITGYVQIWYMLYGSNADCVLRPLLSYGGTVSQLSGEINSNGSGTGGNYTYCSVLVAQP